MVWPTRTVLAGPRQIRLSGLVRCRVFRGLLLSPPLAFRHISTFPELPRCPRDVHREVGHFAVSEGVFRHGKIHSCNASKTFLIFKPLMRYSWSRQSTVKKVSCVNGPRTGPKLSLLLRSACPASMELVSAHVSQPLPKTNMSMAFRNRAIAQEFGPVPASHRLIRER